MLRYLTERLPAMVCPRWVDTRLQPLAESDLMSYLERALDVPAGVYEIGSPEVTTYHAMMELYAEVRGLHRRAIVKVPLLTPSLSARWVDLVTPVDRAVSHALINSLTNEVVIKDGTHTDDAFDIQPMRVADAIRATLDDQASRMPGNLFDLDEGLMNGIYAIRSDAPATTDQCASVRADLSQCGGDLRWYGARRLWLLRIGLGRCFGEHLRMHRPGKIEVGAAVDWWTVKHLDSDSIVLATTWFFGDAWLGYRVDSDAGSTPQETSDARGRVVQVAAFRPRGVPGFAYWRLLWPLHRRVFLAMVNNRINRTKVK